MVRLTRQVAGVVRVADRLGFEFEFEFDDRPDASITRPVTSGL